jgi:phosphoglycolate phosphatase
LYDGIESILKKLDSFYMAVLTNKSKVFALPILDQLGIASYFRRVVCREDVEYIKPDPQGLMSLISASNLPSHQVLMIGDTSIDIQTAHNAMASSCGVCFGYGLKKDILDAKPSFVADSVIDLELILEEFSHE